MASLMLRIMINLSIHNSFGSELVGRNWLSWLSERSAPPCNGQEEPQSVHKAFQSRKHRQLNYFHFTLKKRGLIALIGLILVLFCSAMCAADWVEELNNDTNGP